MSGGHFEYLQYKIHDAADELNCCVEHNEVATQDEFGDSLGAGFPEDVVKKLQETADTLELAAHRLHLADYLICGDHNIETFKEEWKKLDELISLVPNSKAANQVLESAAK
jgi:hypothetical protein